MNNKITYDDSKFELINLDKGTPKCSAHKADLALCVFNTGATRGHTIVDKCVRNTQHKKMSKERKKMIRKITANIPNCEIEDKIHIFNVIGKKIDMVDLQEEGLGVRIWFSLMDDILLNKINDLITDAIEKTKLNLDSDPESD